VPAPRPQPRGVDPDVALAATVLADEQRLVDLVDATVEQHPGLRDALAPTRDVHAAHVELLNDAVPDGAAAVSPSPASPPVSPEVTTEITPSPTESPSATSTPSPGETATAVPGRRGDALAALAAAEDALALLDKRSAFAARSGAFARVLASMAAAATQQAVLLAQLPAARGGR
jgi:hypothetical protein